MKRIIIADDDPGIQEAMSMIMRRAGYNATILPNADALLQDNFEEPDLFIIDRQLHDTDGLEVCRFLKSRKTGGSTPVIIFSASGLIAGLAKEAGADDFLAKPFTIKTLIGMIERYVT